MGRLEGKTAMITGCNRGIGLAILKLFAKEGANIIACTRKRSSDISETYDNLKKLYDIDIHPYYFELSDESSLISALKEISKNHRTIDILVNNAGIASFPGIMRLKMDELKDIFQINFFSPVRIIQSLVLSLMKSNNGSIINIASVAGIDPEPGNSAYGASKAALINMSKSISKELASAHIRVNCIAPGFISTDMNDNIDHKKIGKDEISISLKRLGLPEEVAKVALFLASEDSSYVTGQVVRVDGGL